MYTWTDPCDFGSDADLTSLFRESLNSPDFDNFSTPLGDSITTSNDSLPLFPASDSQQLNSSPASPQQLPFSPSSTMATTATVTPLPINNKNQDFPANVQNQFAVERQYRYLTQQNMYIQQQYTQQQMFLELMKSQREFFDKILCRLPSVDRSSAACTHCHHGTNTPQTAPFHKNSLAHNPLSTFVDTSAACSLSSSGEPIQSPASTRSPLSSTQTFESMLGKFRLQESSPNSTTDSSYTPLTPQRGGTTVNKRTRANSATPNQTQPPLSKTQPQSQEGTNNSSNSFPQNAQPESTFSQEAVGASLEKYHDELCTHMKIRNGSPPVFTIDNNVNGVKLTSPLPYKEFLDRFGFALISVPTFDAKLQDDILAEVRAEFKLYGISDHTSTTQFAQAKKKGFSPDHIDQGAFIGALWKNNLSSGESLSPNDYRFSALGQSHAAWQNRQATAPIWRDLLQTNTVCSSMQGFLHCSPHNAHTNTRITPKGANDCSVPKFSQENGKKIVSEYTEKLQKLASHRLHYIPQIIDKENQIRQHDYRGLLAITPVTTLCLVPGLHHHFDSLLEHMSSPTQNGTTWNSHRKSIDTIIGGNVYSFLLDYLMKIPIPPGVLCIWTTKMPEMIIKNVDYSTSSCVGQYISMFDAHSLSTAQKEARMTAFVEGRLLNNYEATRHYFIAIKNGGAVLPGTFRHTALFQPSEDITALITGDYADNHNVHHQSDVSQNLPEQYLNPSPDTLPPPPSSSPYPLSSPPTLSPSSFSPIVIPPIPEKTSEECSPSSQKSPVVPSSPSRTSSPFSFAFQTTIPSSSKPKPPLPGFFMQPPPRRTFSSKTQPRTATPSKPGEMTSISVTTTTSTKKIQKKNRISLRRVKKSSLTSSSPQSSSKKEAIVLKKRKLTSTSTSISSSIIETIRPTKKPKLLSVGHQCISCQSHYLPTTNQIGTIVLPTCLKCGGCKKGENFSRCHSCSLCWSSEKKAHFILNQDFIPCKDLPLLTKSPDQRSRLYLCNQCSIMMNVFIYKL